MGNGHHHHHAGHDHEAGENGEAGMAELLDLDAEVLHAYLSEVIGWVCELAADRPPGGSSTWAAAPAPGPSPWRGASRTPR